METVDIPTTTPPPQIARMPKSQVKTMLITYFNIKDIAHFEYITQGRRVSRAYYMEILKRLREVVRRKSLELWPKYWILHHDIVPAQKALSSTFWPQNRLLKWNTHHILLICLRMTCVCFQK
jgi:hypothetical protein